MKFSIPTQVAMIVIVLIAVTWWEGSAASTQSLSVLAFVALIAAVCFWYFYSCTPRKFGLTCSACNKSLVGIALQTDTWIRAYAHGAKTGSEVVGNTEPTPSRNKNPTPLLL